MEESSIRLAGRERLPDGSRSAAELGPIGMEESPVRLGGQ
jgi:hypothetical protein